MVGSRRATLLLALLACLFLSLVPVATAWGEEEQEDTREAAVVAGERVTAVDRAEIERVTTEMLAEESERAERFDDRRAQFHAQELAVEREQSALHQLSLRQGDTLQERAALARAEGELSRLQEKKQTDLEMELEERRREAAERRGEGGGMTEDEVSLREQELQEEAAHRQVIREEEERQALEAAARAHSIKIQTQDLDDDKERLRIQEAIEESEWLDREEAEEEEQRVQEGEFEREEMERGQLTPEEEEEEREAEEERQRMEAEEEGVEERYRWRQDQEEMEEEEEMAEDDMRRAQQNPNLSKAELKQMEEDEADEEDAEEEEDERDRSRNAADDDEDRRMEQDDATRAQTTRYVRNPNGANFEGDGDDSPYFQQEYDLSKTSCNADVLHYRRHPAVEPPPFNLSCPWLFEDGYTPLAHDGTSPRSLLCSRLAHMLHDVLYVQNRLVYHVNDRTMLSAYRNNGQLDSDPDLDIRVWLPDIDQRFKDRCGRVAGYKARLFPLTALLDGIASVEGMSVEHAHWSDNDVVEWGVWKLVNGTESCGVDVAVGSVQQSRWFARDKPCTCPYGEGLVLCPTPILHRIEEEFGPTWFFALPNFSGYRNPGQWESGLKAPLDADTPYARSYRENARGAIMSLDANHDDYISSDEVLAHLASAAPDHAEALRNTYLARPQLWEKRAEALNDLIKAIQITEENPPAEDEQQEEEEEEEEEEEAREQADAEEDRPRL